MAVLKTDTASFIGGQVTQVIDAMGQASATAQGLGAVITTHSKLMNAQGSQNLYILVKGTKALGLLKTGDKSLYISAGVMTNIRPRCVLDFYVHESLQRQGVGQALFEFMLEYEKVEAHMLAYDRPSNKLLGFLRKYYNLSNYSPQVNNFVIYNEYFSKKKPKASSNNMMVKNDYSSQSQNNSM